jgi:hypothetical protein
VLATRAPASPGVAAVGGVVVTGAVVAAVLLALGSSSWDTGGAVVIGPTLLAVSAPVLARQARREGDPRLFWLLLLALSLKLAGAMVRHFVAFQVYEGASDAVGYHEAGIRWMGQIRSGHLDSGGQPLTGTNFVELVTGVVYLVTGPTLLGGFLVFSWLGFWGLFFFYRAFTAAVPDGRSRTYARLLFFLPSLVFWPSSIGKEAWMMFTLGAAAFGAAKVLTGQTLGGLPLFGAGLWLAAQVRPHIAGLVAVAAGVALLVTRRSRAPSAFGGLPRVVALAALGGVAVLLALKAERYLIQSRIQTTGGVEAVLQEVNRRTAQGGSEFEAHVADSPLEVPMAVFTALFRPLPVEARSLQVLVSSAETSFLLVLAVARWRWIAAALRSLRRRPYVTFALVTLVFVSVAFSAIANFGILARERVQVLPLFLVLLAVPPTWAGVRRPAS